jgi:hypothetical protein
MVEGDNSHGRTPNEQGDYTGDRYVYLDRAERLGAVIKLLENYRP